MQRFHLSLAAACWVLAGLAAALTFSGRSAFFSGPLLPGLVLFGAIHMAAFYGRLQPAGAGLASALVAFLTPLLVYGSMLWIGFPDGSRTELERAMEALFPVFTGLSLTLGVCLMVLAWRSRRGASGRGLSLASVALVLFFAAAIAAGAGLSAVLDHGTGG